MQQSENLNSWSSEKRARKKTQQNETVGTVDSKREKDRRYVVQNEKGFLCTF